MDVEKSKILALLTAEPIDVAVMLLEFKLDHIQKVGHIVTRDELVEINGAMQFLREAVKGRVSQEEEK